MEVLRDPDKPISRVPNIRRQNCKHYLDGAYIPGRIPRHICERGPLAESPSSLSLSSGRVSATGCRAASAYRGRATPCCQSTATASGLGPVKSRTDGAAVRLRERPQSPAEATWTLRFVFNDDGDVDSGGDGDGDGDGDKGYL